MTILINYSDYDSEVRQIGHHTRDCDSKKYIIINQTSWYDADKWTDETAAADYMKTMAINKREPEITSGPPEHK